MAVNDDYTISKDGVLTVAAAAGVLTNDTDVNGDSLTASMVTQPAHGTLSLAADGSFTYTPNTGFSGEDSFTYTASDGTTNSINATVTITVSPTVGIPVAASDQYEVTEGQTLLVNAATGVLANDTDADPLTAVIETQPSHGR